jgi:hypothetical protein
MKHPDFTYLDSIQNRYMFVPDPPPPDPTPPSPPDEKPSKS